MGVHGNELADGEAKTASEQDDLPIRSVRIPHSDYYSAFTATVRNRWQVVWRSQIDSKLRGIKETVQPWMTSWRRSRKEEVVLTRMRIGNTRTTHEFLLKGEEPPICEECDAPRTVSHLLPECREYAATRRRVFDPGGARREALTLGTILDNDGVAVQKLFQFLQLTSLLSGI